MDSPSSGATFLPEVAQPRRALPGRSVVIAGFGSGLAADFLAFLDREPRGVAILADGPNVGVEIGDEPTSLVLFLAPSLTDPDRRRLADLILAASRWPLNFVAIVGTFRVHLDDPVAAATEREVLQLIRSGGITARVAVFRPGHVLGQNSGVSRWLRRLSPFSPLAPIYLRTCFVEGSELFAAIEAERSDGGEGADTDGPGRRPGRHQRVYTLLGANVSWRQMLERHRVASSGQRLVTTVAEVLSWLLVGSMVGLVVGLLARWVAMARSWSVGTIQPRSLGELLALCHRGNIERVRVVGYNNGVNHFGHRHPGRTIVSTSRCRRARQAGPGILQADSGATIRDARDFLQDRGEELYVVPNYSYVALGTAFFVPIHGSAVDYSTVADTMERVVLFDPDRDRIISASRDEAAFREHVYNPRSRAVVLRLYLRVKPKSSYFVRRETREGTTANDLLEALRDRDAANVEIRQGHAASPRVTIARYYTSAGDPSAPALESPRDALGQLWDRLEENPVTSFLMHALSRHLAWHTELFFTPGEFETFWRTHAEVPLRKIQLRYIRRDGMPHSPFRDEDCVSADLFLFRKDKPSFDAYIDRTFGSVRTNPGKHSN